MLSRSQGKRNDPSRAMYNMPVPVKAEVNYLGLNLDPFEFVKDGSQIYSSDSAPLNRANVINPMCHY